MAERPSDPLLGWLREQLARRKMNTARLADAIGAPRTRARRVLAGDDDMTVDELMLVMKALGIGPEDLGVTPPATSDTDPADEATPPPPVEAALGDPWGNHPEQLFRMGFALGCDLLFLARADALADSGVPPRVLEMHAGKDLPIRLDAAYHGYMRPRYDAKGVVLTLSFDRTCDCTFPWSAIHQVNFYPAIPDAVTGDDVPPPQAPKRGGHLRLVSG